MYPQWSSSQSNEERKGHMPQQPFHQGFFQFPSMWQQQGQSMFQTMSPFPNTLLPMMNNVPPPGAYTYTANNNPATGQYQWQSSYSSETRNTQGLRGDNNQISYERNPNQQQYASYPQGATYRRASGPGWQQQEVYYSPNSFQ